MHLHLKKGALHHNLHVPAGQKIPRYKLEEAKHSTNDLIRKRANFAINAAKWSHKVVKHMR
jgi:hypothetical protein